MSIDRDPRWEWIPIPTYNNPDLVIKGQCRHLEIEPVHDIAGTLVARLCRTCDAQLPPSREAE